MRVATLFSAFLGATARRLPTCVLVLACLFVGTPTARAASMDPALLPTIQAATFEVVAAKPTDDPLTYEKPLPLDLLPYQRRTDKYYSIGTAFAIGDNRYVTAGHVLKVGVNSLWGPPALRDSNGHVYAIDKIEKYSLERDFVVFSLVHPPSTPVLQVDTTPTLNQVVYAVGNALGTGVIIRDGLYTSNTPEDQDGRWQWMRFSAAASPGNSGGPLLDKDGHVIGVVLMKSANENLNYALPMAEVMGAPAHTAEMDKRIPYVFDVFDTTLSNRFQATFTLPLSLTDFYAQYARHMYAFDDAQLKAILAKDPDRMFPNGANANEVLHDHGTFASLPELIVRGSNDVWGRAPSRERRVSLPDNGYVALGLVGSNMLFHLRKPDSLPADQLYGHPVKLMDLLLKIGFPQRAVGPEKVKITSMGKPVVDTPFTDRWQRKWVALEWTLPYANGRYYVIAMAVPDGYVGLLRGGQASQEHDYLINLQALTDFMVVNYNGSLAQWKDFLAHPDLLPDALRQIKISFDYGKRFSFDSSRVAFDFTPKLQTIAKDSRLNVGFRFFREHGKVIWGVEGIRVTAKASDDGEIGLTRVQAPTPDLDDNFQNYWTKLVNRRHPYDGVALNDDDVMQITSVIGKPAAAKPAAVYAVHYYEEGKRPQAHMRDQLDLLLKNLRVHEAIGTTATVTKADPGSTPR